jgi:hypothetical protein
MQMRKQGERRKKNKEKVSSFLPFFFVYWTPHVHMSSPTHSINRKMKEKESHMRIER